jgi:hypothetical protein
MRRAHHHAFDDRLSTNYDLVFSHGCLTSRKKTMVAAAASSSRMHLLTVPAKQSTGGYDRAAPATNIGLLMS